MEYMLSKAGKQLAVIDEYKFGFHKNLSGDIARWKCTKRGCTAFIKVFNEVIVEQNLDHDHGADTTLARQKISNSLKRKASDALCERPTKIIRREIASSGMSDVVTTDDMNRFRKNLSAAKLRKFPKLPTTVLELHECVRTYSLKTTTGENFVVLFRNLLMNLKKEKLPEPNT